MVILLQRQQLTFQEQIMYHVRPIRVHILLHGNSKCQMDDQHSRMPDKGLCNFFPNGKRWLYLNINK